MTNTKMPPLLSSSPQLMALLSLLLLTFAPLLCHGQAVVDPDTHWTFVIDTSSSTGDNTINGGDPDACGKGINVLECQIAAVFVFLDVLTTTGRNSSETVRDIGISSYSSPNAVTHLFDTGGGVYLAEPGDPAINVTLQSLRSGGRTNFAAGLQAAYKSLVETNATSKKLVFLSDGKANRPRPADNFFYDALEKVSNIENLVATYTYAVGRQEDVSCTESLEPGAGTLKEIAEAAPEGYCTLVEPQELRATLELLAKCASDEPIIEDGLTCPGSGALSPTRGAWSAMAAAVAAVWLVLLA